MALLENFSFDYDLNDGIEKSLSNPGERKNTIPNEIGEKPENQAKFKDTHEENNKQDIPQEIGDRETDRVGISEKIKEKLLNSGMSESLVSRCVQDADGKVYLPDRVSKNENGENKDFAVPYRSKLLNIDGIKVEGLFPEFKSKFDCVLPPDKIKATDFIQMSECTKQLAQAIEKDPKLAKKFDSVQLEQIKNGEPRIRGSIWHHNEEKGKMQLVDYKEHEANRHNGGKSIWGGER